MRRLKRIVADDSPRIHKILEDSMRIVPGLEMIAVLDSEKDAPKVFKEHQSAAVVLDLIRWIGGGLKVLRKLKHRAETSRVLVFTGYDNEQYRVRRMVGGTDNFFSKNR